MDLRTTQRIEYQPFKVIKKQKKVVRPNTAYVPMANSTSYRVS